MRGFLLCLTLFLTAGWAQSQTGLQPIPVLSARVIDNTRTLTAGQRQALDDKLAAFEKIKGSQIVVLMVPTTLPEDIVSYTQRVGDSWKIGRKGIGDGLLLVVAKNDRSVRIATAKTLEGAIPDLVASQVIERALTPRFRNGDFAGGLNAGIDLLIALISGEKLPESSAVVGAAHEPGFQWLDLAVLLFVAVPFAARVLGSILGRKFGSLLTGAAIGALVWLLTTSIVLAVLLGMAGMVVALASLLSSGGRRAGWGAGMGGFGNGRNSGGFGGGFSSGGGGNFGGGGASGKW